MAPERDLERRHARPSGLVRYLGRVFGNQGTVEPDSAADLVRIGPDSAVFRASDGVARRRGRVHTAASTSMSSRAALRTSRARTAESTWYSRPGTVPRFRESDEVDEVVFVERRRSVPARDGSPAGPENRRGGPRAPPPDAGRAALQCRQEVVLLAAVAAHQELHGVRRRESHLQRRPQRPPGRERRRQEPPAGAAVRGHGGACRAAPRGEEHQVDAAARHRRKAGERHAARRAWAARPAPERTPAMRSGADAGQTAGKGLLQFRHADQVRRRPGAWSEGLASSSRAGLPAHSRTAEHIPRILLPLRQPAPRVRRDLARHLSVAWRPDPEGTSGRRRAHAPVVA